jgi:DNA repair exonuclease SbcCD nuclease subunit
MRLLHVSDLHAKDHWYRWLAKESRSYDMVCITGDLLDAAEGQPPLDQIQMVATHLRSIVVPMAICSGNHDAQDDSPGGVDWLRQLRRPQVWTDGDAFELKGVRIRCQGWLEHLEPAGLDDVWLAHCPPTASKPGSPGAALTAGTTSWETSAAKVSDPGWLSAVTSTSPSDIRL